VAALLPASKKVKATGVASLKNIDLNYVPISSLVLANVNGQHMASTFINGLEDYYGDSDALYLAVTALLSGGRNIEALTTLRGFLRTIQKRLENLL